MRIHTRVQESEYLEALLIAVPRWKVFLRRWLPPVFVFFFLFAYASSKHTSAGFSLAWQDFGRELPVKLICAGIGAVFCFLVNGRNTRKWQTKRYKAFVALCPGTWQEFLPDRHLIEISGGETASVPWSSYTSWSEGNSVFILKTNSKGFRIVPKTGLNNEQLTEIKRILSAALPLKK